MKRGAELRQRRKSALLTDAPLDRDACPHPAKTCYRTKSDAKRAITRVGGLRRDAVQAYRCDCGSWHIGHKLRRKAA